jgi:hypothetical protein
MSKRAGQAALEAYPDSERDKTGIVTFLGFPQAVRDYYIKGYEQAEKDFIDLVKQYIERGERCMEQEGESQIYSFWDGFHNCAENILRELEVEHESD